MPTQISIEIDKMRSGKDRAFVDPPIKGIGTISADTVTWTNNTGAVVRLWFPNGGKVFDPAKNVPPVPDFSNPIPIDVPGSPTGNTFTAAIKAGPTYGYYKYSVYCEKAGVEEFAQGNSEPGLHVP